MKKIILLGISICLYSFTGVAQSSQQAYCTSNLHNNSCKQDYIDIVQITGTSLHNSGTGCNDTLKSYFSFPAADSTTTTLTRGATYILGVLAYSYSKIGMWIDYNQNSTFESTEFTQVTTYSNPSNIMNVYFTIPLTATKGATKMRIRARYNPFALGATDACTTFGTAETEDYTLTIDDATGINDNISEGSLDIYPIPAQEQISISFETKNAESAVINLVNVEGQVIYSEKATDINGKFSTKINAEKISNGIYFLQIKSNKQLITRKIVVAK